ncbi:MAG: DNA-processing protein DprA [Lachnospiraceae bacterium]|nr:DNA-processing protein DprA [Lachnospiraceae bacterium]
MDFRIENIEKIEDSMLPYAHWLYSINGIGSKTIRHILAQVETPEALYRLPKEKIESVLPPLGRKPELAEKIVVSRQKHDIWEEYLRLVDRQIKFTCIGHSDYPYRLSNISDAPYGIYYRGKLPEQSRPSVAIIGARNCSEYGRRMAKYFGSELAMMGVQVISGMARGIDGIGQKAALEAGGYSLGVLGCGVDICYPEENRALYDMLCLQGGACSEYLPGIMPKNSLFPPRNRIISGLSDIVLVIEAKNRSGTLITVDMALEQGKEVYALPGRVTDALSEGCNRLLQQGAGIALSPQEIVKELMGKVGVLQKERSFCNRKADGKNVTQTIDKCKNTTLLSDVQSKLIQILEEEPQPAEIIKEQLLSKTGCDLPMPELLNQLIKLCIFGLVRQVGNSYFAKN